MNRYPLSWAGISKVSGIRFRCGYCGTDTAPPEGWVASGQGGKRGFVLACTACNHPTFIDIEGVIQNTTPAVKMGADVSGLPDDVAGLYDEARKCTAASSYTSAVLTCRKVLMHIAVEKGAPAGKSFVEYVDYLATNNYIPPDGKDWVDYIRTKSNEANHEITLMDSKDADDLITFTEMLLRLVYEFKQRLPNQGTPPAVP